MEQTWYDARGTATAYVSQDGKTIHLWNGRVVAYLTDDRLYSWQRGRNLGWFVDGVVYDGRGKRVGFSESACPVPVIAVPVKKAKTKPGPRGPKAGAQTRPALSTATSDLAFGAFLQS
ncbi:4-fold beta flower protein [Nocardioides sp.]|uniref:4-fold beta flower protein n=1 Tax=Nocardioides sp. TaxID=35761 RepID=UPI003A5C1419